MPGLAAFAKKLTGKPFVLLAMERQNSSEADVARICKEKGLVDNVCVMSGGDYPASKGGGIPHAIVFNHTGKEIFQGYPTEAEAVVEKALESTPNLYLGELTYVKLKPLAAQIEKKSGLGQAAASLRKKVESTDEAEKAEAAALLEALEKYASLCTASAETLKDSDPDRALQELKTLAKEFSGDVLGTEAGGKAAALAADPEFKRLQDGFRKLSAQLKKLDGLPPCKPCKGTKGLKAASLSCDGCRKANEAVLSPVRKSLEDLKEKFQGTSVASKADAALAGL